MPPIAASDIPVLRAHTRSSVLPLFNFKLLKIAKTAIMPLKMRRKEATMVNNPFTPRFGQTPYCAAPANTTWAAFPMSR